MPETCFVCEYKRLAREALAALEQTASLLRMIDPWCGNHFESIRRRMLREFLDLHTAQVKESALPNGGNGTGIVSRAAPARTRVLVEGPFARPTV